MAALKRLLKPRFLNAYLEAGYRAFDPPFAVAVWTEGERLAGAREASPDKNGALTLPLRAGGKFAGELVVQAAPASVAHGEERATATIHKWAAFLATSLQAIIDAQEARRSVSAEALDLYRELSQFHRAAVALNRSLHQVDVADALLAELAEGGGAVQAGMVFRLGAQGQDFQPLRQLAGAGGIDLAPVARSHLFQEIVEAGHGEIVNDLSADPRWRGEARELTSILIVPLLAQEQCFGALVLGIVDAAREFTAADLKRASTLASMAATALRNAQLFEEVLEIKNDNETILQNLSNGVITLDRAGKVARANAAALRILGRRDADPTGRPVEDIFQDRNAWVLDSVAAVPRGEGQSTLIDKELWQEDGRSLTVNLNVLPLANVERETIGTMLVFEDVTREKRLRGTMVRFMSDRVVEQLLEGGESVLGGTAQEVSILFSDIRRFTGLAETLSPRELVATLNEYFTAMVDVIFERGGTLDKFIGDALMAVFGAPFVSPDDTDHAVEAAIDMIRRLHAFNRDGAKRGRRPLDIGVGINTGEVVAGTIGSPKRMDYTVIGDHVNLAARIEAANRYYGTKLLVSEHTVEKLAGRHTTRELDRVRVHGRNLPVRLFEVLDHHTRTSFPHIADGLAAFEGGLHHYRRREWELGARCFADALRANPKDRPTQIFLDRCWTYIAQPPDDSWTDITDLGSLGK
jgi:PAS domain S-box-containing protein